LQEQQGFEQCDRILAAGYSHGNASRLRSCGNGVSLRRLCAAGFFEVHQTRLADKMFFQVAKAGVHYLLDPEKLGAEQVRCSDKR